MVRLLLAVAYLLATVPRSEAQEAESDQPGPRLGGPFRGPNNPNSPPRFTQSPGVSTSTSLPSADESTIPGFKTISTPSTAKIEVPAIRTIPIGTPSDQGTHASPTKAILGPNGDLTERSSTSVGDPLATNPNMATLPPAGATIGQNPVYPSTTGVGSGSSGSSGSSSDSASNRTLIITLSTVLSVVAFLIIFGSIYVCYRLKRGRLPVFRRGISPIDDEEIESWKVNNRADEKYTSFNGTHDKKHNSAGSVKKPPSVIVYQNPAVARASGEHSPQFFVPAGTPHHPHHHHHHHHHHQRQQSHPRSIIDMAPPPQTPVLARAPNSRPGLTDETVEGDDAFIVSPKPSRLSKLPSPRHTRTRSSRSSLSVASSQAWPGSPLSPRASNDYNGHYYIPRTSHGYERTGNHSRIYSNSSNPPRLSFDDEFFLGGLSPRPLLRKSDLTPESQIGRAIG